ncbi:MAG: acyl-CoA/acyl-ACP dehydrogenase [Candidatus Obscuribacterales bacterium]|jgi:alkylation response protein AidB-like acyl-CoA dehydrogenase|nr:acyl-CoA/acyl-ACP dehydrogenase [Candidatus Obscuribacterales bacterium]
MKTKQQERTTELQGKNAKAQSNGPIHQAIWESADLRAFSPSKSETNPQVDRVLADSIAAAKKMQTDGTLYDKEGKITQDAMDTLGRAGYWGVLVPTEYGGSGATFAQFASLVTKMAAAGFATEAGIAGMHGCIGAVSSLTRYGNEDQKRRFLPLLASGQRTSGFALTEPCAGSDLGSLRTVARREGDEYVINGEKLFNGNCIPGRLIRLVAKVEGEEKPAEFIVELPQENEHFQLVRYKILAVRQGRNNGLKFTNFRIPAANRIEAPNGNGLIPIYIGLNYGRVAVGANCAGIMRLLLKSICPWANYRETFGKKIETREKVKNGIARLAALIVGADALRDWCAELLDQGERAELECIIAKVFSASALKEAAFDIAMMIHGGRSFLGEHIVGENVHDYLAPSIYEGQNDMLSMKFFATLVKEHGMEYHLPLGNAVKEVKQGKFVTGGVKAAATYAKYLNWKLAQRVKATCGGGSGEGCDQRLARHVVFAERYCAKLSVELSSAMMKHGAKTADRQSRVVLLSQRVQDAILMMVTATAAMKSGHATNCDAADILCQDLRRKLTGEHPTDEYFHACAKLADKVIDGDFLPLEGTMESPVLRQYK